MHGFLHEMRRCCIFRCAVNPCWGCREFEFDMVFCFGIRLAPYAVFFFRPAFHEEINTFEDWIFVRLSSLVLDSEWTTNQNKFIV